MPAPAASRERETLYLLLCHDAPGSAAPRETHMQGHLDFIAANLSTIALGGPRSDGVSAIDGSVLLIRAGSASAARAFVAGDPYFKAGVWARIEVHPMRAVCGSYIGGVTW